MFELMTWNEIVDSIISEGKLKKAAIFDLKGDKLAGTGGINIGRNEALAVLNCLHYNSTSIFSLFVEDTKFNFLAVDENTMIGRNPNDIFVAHRSNNVLICGFTDVKSDVSCLGGVKEFATKLMDRDVATGVVVPSLM